MIRFVAMAGFVAAMVLAVACGDDQSPEEATAQLCSDMAELDAAVQNLQALNQSDTVNDLESAQADFQNAFEDVRASAANVSDARVDDLAAAQTGLEQTVSTLDGDQTIAAVQTEIQSAVGGVAAARDQLNESVNCP